MIDSILKFARLSWSDRLLVLETTLALAVAAITIAALPFRYVAGWSDRPIRRASPRPDVRSVLVKRVRWAVLACAIRVPWRAVCLQQGLAAHFMLRRRGVPVTLYYGAVPNDGVSGIRAHAWVKDGDTDVVGGESASQFAVLAMFPSEDEPGNRTGTIYQGRRETS